MLKLIAILTGCSLTPAFGAQPAEQTDQVDAKKQSQKPKNVQKQQFTPKQQQTGPNTHVQKLQTQHINKPVTNTVNTNVPKQQKMQRMAPRQTNTPPTVQS